jgi:hypothetical protein
MEASASVSGRDGEWAVVSILSMSVGSAVGGLGRHSELSGGLGRLSESVGLSADGLRRRKNWRSWCVSRSTSVEAARALRERLGRWVRATGESGETSEGGGETELGGSLRAVWANSLARERGTPRGGGVGGRGAIAWSTAAAAVVESEVGNGCWGIGSAAAEVGEFGRTSELRPRGVGIVLGHQNVF